MSVGLTRYAKTKHPSLRQRPSKKNCTIQVNSQSQLELSTGITYIQSGLQNYNINKFRGQTGIGFVFFGAPRAGLEMDLGQLASVGQLTV